MFADSFDPSGRVSTILAYIELCLLIRAIVLLSEAIYWRRFEEVTKSTNPESENSNNCSSVNHALATVSIKFNAISQALAALLSSTCNIAAIFVFVLGLKSEYEMMDQTNGTAIITAPFFFGVAYFGYTTAKTGSNKRLVTFLSLSVLCGLLSFLEGGGSEQGGTHAVRQVLVAGHGGGIGATGGKSGLQVHPLASDSTRKRWRHDGLCAPEARGRSGTVKPRRQGSAARPTRATA